MPETPLRLNRPPRFGVQTLGFGTRASIWLQGCTLACPGCASLDTWDANGGTAWTVHNIVDAVHREVGSLAGLTITGGEPFQQPGALLALLQELRNGMPEEFDVLCFSGYRIETLKAKFPHHLDLIDVIVDGRYHVDEPTDLPLRGSANQRLHALSPLGQRRYGSALPSLAESSVASPSSFPPGLQFVVTDDGFELIGIPRAGDLLALESVLAEQGIELGGVSWR